jgi:hypothetical protein
VSRWRVGLAACFFVATIAAIVSAREMRLGARACAAMDAAGDAATAIARARDAAEAVVPGSPYPRRGYERLEAVARDAEAHGDEPTAITAWGAMRTAADATAGPLVATSAWRALADEGLLRVGAHPLAPSAEVHATEDILRASLARDDAPAAGWLALLGLGALAFLGGVARLAWAARDLAALRGERAAMIGTTLGALLYALACLRG